MSMCAHIFAGVHKGQRTLDPLELDLQMVMGYLVWMLETKPGFFARAISTLSLWVILTIACSPFILMSYFFVNLLLETVSCNLRVALIILSLFPKY